MDANYITSKVKITTVNSNSVNTYFTNKNSKKLSKSIKVRISKLKEEIKKIVHKLSIAIMKAAERIVTQCYEGYKRLKQISFFNRIEFYLDYDDT